MLRVGGGGDCYGMGGGKRGEMTQTLYAYMNKRKTKKMFKKGSELHLEPPWD
jgi:hypothetical protein